MAETLLHSILSDAALKGVRRRQTIIDFIVSGEITLEQIAAALPAEKEPKQASVLEALEEISNKGLCRLAPEAISLAVPFISSANNSCRREASRIIGNLSSEYHTLLQPAIAPLLDNTSDEGSVIRWSAAYALSRIILTPTYLGSPLHEQIRSIEAAEQDSGVRNQYTKALRKADKELAKKK